MQVLPGTMLMPRPHGHHTMHTTRRRSSARVKRLHAAPHAHCTSQSSMTRCVQSTVAAMLAQAQDAACSS